MAIKIQIIAEDKATPVINKALDAPKKKASETAAGIKRGFADAFENVTQNATGSFGSVAGGLFKIPGPAGIAAAAILAIGGALFNMAKKAAEATAATDVNAARFLTLWDKLSERVSSNLDIIGSAVIPAFTDFAEAIGLTATAEEVLTRQIVAQQEAVVKSVKSYDDFVAKLNEYITASERAKEVQLSTQLVNAVVAGNSKLAASLSQQITLQGILKTKVKEVAIEQKAGGDSARKIFEENRKRFEDEQKFLDAAAKLRANVERTLAAQQQGVYEEARERRRVAIDAETESMIAQARREVAAFDAAKVERLKQLEEVRLKQIEIGQQIVSGVAGGLAQAVIQGESLKKVLDDILKQLATRLLTKLILGGLTSILGGGAGLGVIGKLFGGFQHGGSFTVGGAGGVDQNLVAFRATRGERVTVTPASTTNNVTNNNSTPVNLSVNVNARNFDRNFVLSELVPLLNREVKNGLDLYASKIK